MGQRPLRRSLKQTLRRGHGAGTTARQPRTWIYRRFLLSVCVALGLTAVGCRRAPEGWSPVLERTSTIFLQRKVEEVATDIDRARSSMGTDPHRAAAELERASSSVQELLAYYLPLLEAREGAYNAYRELLLGNEKGAREELDRMEAILLAIAHRDGSQVVGEMTRALQQLEETRIAV